MSTISRYLPLSDLQGALPLDQVEQFGNILRQIEPGRKHLDLFTDKAFLGRLFESYCGAELLGTRPKRRKLLDYVPPGELQKLAARLSVPAATSFKKLADIISKLPWGQNENTKCILEFFDLPADFMPDPQPQTLTQEVLQPLLPAHRALYDYQSGISFRGSATLKPPCARVLIQMPTGSGKTRTAMEIVASFINSKPQTKALWIAHSEELCDQAIDSFQAVWRHLGTSPISLCRCWSEYTPSFPLPDASFTVAGFPKLTSLRRQALPPPQADLLVVDEAHMVLAPTFAAAVSWCASINARLLGLSATPGRTTAGDFENEQLANFFNRKILGVETDGSGVVEYLQGKGVLSRAEREPLYTNISFHLTAEEWKALEEELDYPKRFLERVATDHERNKIIIQKLYDLANTKAQVLVFAASVEQSRMLCAALSYKGARAAHVDADTTAETRRAFIGKFRRGDINVLCNYSVLATGFDAPKTDVIFIARPTKSIVLYSQMIGRGMRGPAVGGTAYFRLIDVIDNVVDYSSDFDDVYNYFSEYWAP